MKSKLLTALASLMLFCATVVQGATVSETFTTVRSGAQLQVRANDRFYYSVTGSYLGYWVLERTKDNGVSWEVVRRGKHNTEGFFRVYEPYAYRFRCTSFTNGTSIITSLQDQNADVPENKEIYNLHGESVAKITEYGLDIQTLTVSSGASIATFNATDSGFSIKDNADQTKIAQFQASGITTGTTRTYTLPNADSTLVGITGTTGDSNLGTISSVSLSSYYFGTVAATFVGALSSSQAKTVTYQKIGRVVTLSIPATSTTCNSAATINNTGTELPSGLRPLSATKFAVNGVFDNSGSDINSGMEISTAGVITVYGNAAGGNFTASGSCGWDRAIAVTYVSNN